MTILECFETEAFNELINFSFEEVRAVFNMYGYFIPEQKAEAFLGDAVKAKDWYNEELNKIEVYKQGEYAGKLNAGEDTAEFEEPDYKVRAIEVQAKRKLIKIIITYFDKDLFQHNKKYIFEEKIFKVEAVETPHELLVSLNIHKDRIYNLLSLIGHQQFNKGYFLSRDDFLTICNRYSREVYLMNKELGMEFGFKNIFNKSGRINTINKTRKKKKSDDTTEEKLGDFKEKQKKNHRYIDIDKISLLSLIEPYLKHNTCEITKIMEIMMENFRYGGSGDVWENIIEEVNAFIAECEIKGIMKKL